jgi:ribosomal protein S18 acetylase RimI-like enzyme
MIESNGYSIVAGGVELLDRVEPLWCELRRHHGELAPQWAPGFAKTTFADRRRNVLGKSGGGLLVMLAVHDKADVGYCLVTISAENRAEIDSLFVMAEYRNRGLGAMMMSRALAWLESRRVASIAVEVITGNDSAQRFYERYGFAPRTLRMLRLDGVKS